MLADYNQILNQEEVYWYQKCLDVFCEALGQIINVAKTKILFLKNVSISLANSISMNNGFKVSKDLSKYLRIPLLHQRLTKQTYSYLLESLQKKLTRWKSNNLLLANRITSCKFVLSIVPLYPMQIVILSKHTCNKIEKLCKRFIWGHNKGRDKSNLVNWETSCKSK